MKTAAKDLLRSLNVRDRTIAASAYPAFSDENERLFMRLALSFSQQSRSFPFAYLQCTPEDSRARSDQPPHAHEDRSLACSRANAEEAENSQESQDSPRELEFVEVRASSRFEGRARGGT